jgi:hypothetical protein
MPGLFLEPPREAGFDREGGGAPPALKPAEL